MTSPAGSREGPLSRFIVISFDLHPKTSPRIPQRVTERLQSFGWSNLTTVDVENLTPELVGQLAGIDYAIFIDSPQVGHRVRVKVRSLEAQGHEPAGSSMPASGHSCEPNALLALAHSVYGHHPQAWLVQVYLPKVDPLPPDHIETAIDHAIQQIESLIRPALRQPE